MDHTAAVLVADEIGAALEALEMDARSGDIMDAVTAWIAHSSGRVLTADLAARLAATGHRLPESVVERAVRSGNITVRAGQVYRPLSHGRRIRVTAYTPGHDEAQACDADTGLPVGPVNVHRLYRHPVTLEGRVRRQGHVLER